MMIPGSDRPVTGHWPDTLQFPSPIVRAFTGFEAKAFELLGALKASPFRETYQDLKPDIDQFCMAPFKLLRDDLVLNWVIPNGMDLETERNVFSRLLKNDYGAGASHHHIWLSFYRKHTSRLKDIQLAFTLRPAGVEVNLFVGGRNNQHLAQVRNALITHPNHWLEKFNTLLETGDWSFAWSKGSGRRKKGGRASHSLESLPFLINRADSFWFSRLIDKEEVLALKSNLLDILLDEVKVLWPLYREWVVLTGPDSS